MDYSKVSINHYPLLPLRDIVVFPHMVAPLVVGRQKSILALENAMANKTEIFLATQKDAGLDEPQPESVHRVGTVAAVMQLLRLPDGTIKALVDGKRRGRIVNYIPNDEFFMVAVETIAEERISDTEATAFTRQIQTALTEYAKTNNKVPKEVLKTLATIADPSRFVDVTISHLPLKTDEKQKILETISLAKRLELTLDYIQREVEIAALERSIRSRVKTKMEKTQKEYYLAEQMRAIQKEMGESGMGGDELTDLEEAI